MATELVQQQSMRQEQTMTHHQIQALEMLFAPVMELSSIISGEVEKNPVLEVESEKYEKLELEDVNDEEVAKSNETDEWVEKNSAARTLKPLTAELELQFNRKAKKEDTSLIPLQLTKLYTTTWSNNLCLWA